MEDLANTLGMSIPVVAIDGDRYGQYIQNVCGDVLKSLSYPTILFASTDGEYTKFNGERTPENLISFACEHASKYGPIEACMAN
jgi:hypothetical protein